MTQKICSADVRSNGTLRLPKPVRQALHLRGKDNVVGFIIEGRRILLTRARIVPDTRLSDEEIAALAQLSKRGAGKRLFRTQDAALRYLWSL